MPTPDEPIGADAMALPLMRGFPCPVTTPFMGADAGPKQGIGCGWANVEGLGPQFFVTTHAEGGFAMIASLDYARWRRFAENWASIGQQAMLTGKLDDISPNDPLSALNVALKALHNARASFSARQMTDRANEMREAIAVVEEALFIREPKKDERTKND